MNGIASLLDKAATTRVEYIWKDLEIRCGLVGVKITPFPHFSWQVTEMYDLQRLENVMVGIARHTQPFTIHTAGLGIFTGKNPVLYISIIKDEKLMRFHAQLWEQTIELAINSSPYYAPERWVPHITLAYMDINQANLDCALKNLAFQSFNWEIQIDNLIFVAQTENQSPAMNGYRFGP